MIRATYCYKDDIQSNLRTHNWYLKEDIQDQLNNRTNKMDIKFDLELHHIFFTIAHECDLQKPLVAKGL